MSNYTELKVSTFRERFVELCDSNPLGTISLADELHVSRQTINAWKVGTRSPKDLTVIAIARYFGVDVKWLMGFDVPRETTWVDYKENAEDPPTLKTPEARILAKGIDKMPQEQREAIINMMQGLYPGLFEKGSEEDDT